MDNIPEGDGIHYHIVFNQCLDRRLYNLCCKGTFDPSITVLCYLLFLFHI